MSPILYFNLWRKCFNTWVYFIELIIHCGNTWVLLMHQWRALIATIIFVFCLFIFNGFILVYVIFVWVTLKMYIYCNDCFNLFTKIIKFVIHLQTKVMKTSMMMKMQGRQYTSYWNYTILLFTNQFITQTEQIKFSRNVIIYLYIICYNL